MLRRLVPCILLLAMMPGCAAPPQDRSPFEAQVVESAWDGSYNFTYHIDVENQGELITLTRVGIGRIDLLRGSDVYEAENGRLRFKKEAGADTIKTLGARVHLRTSDGDEARHSLELNKTLARGERLEVIARLDYQDSPEPVEPGDVFRATLSIEYWQNGGRWIASEHLTCYRAAVPPTPFGRCEASNAVQFS